VRTVARQILEHWPPADIIAMTGTLIRVGGNDGIADVYQVAKDLGVRTAGIHPSVARQFALTHRVSPDCDAVFFVDDETWGGYANGTEPSSTLRVHLAVADELVVIGGGKHAADELRAFHDHGRPIRYFAADMNSVTAIEWCRRAGVEIPDFRGAARHTWDDLAR